MARLARDFPREHEPCPIGSDRALDDALITASEGGIWRWRLFTAFAG
jgi:hypothetical protein